MEVVDWCKTEGIPTEDAPSAPDAPEKSVDAHCATTIKVEEVNFSTSYRTCISYGYRFVE